MAKSINAPIDWKNKITGYGVKPASEFVAHPNNWRRHPEAQRQAVRASLDTLGWIDVVIESVRSGYLIDGHERIWGALKNNDADVPYIQVDLTEAEERQALLSLDPISAMAEADKGKLAELLQQTESDDARVTAMLTELAQKEGLHYGDESPEDPGAQIDRASELQEIWQVNSGDLWEIPSQSVPGGAHYLVCGDCTERAVVERVMRGEKAQMMVTDPPYGVEYDPEWRVEAGANERTHGKKLEGDDRADWSNAWALFPGDVAYVWHAGAKSNLVANGLERNGFILLYLIIWNKDLAVIGRGDYHHKHEPCWYAVRKGKPHRFIGDRKQKTVWDIPTIHSFKNGHNADEWGLLGHGTQKPLECMECPIRNHAFEIVYDPFADSGTTGIACERLGRQARLVEISPAYCAVILQRFADLGLAPRRME